MIALVERILPTCTKCNSPYIQHIDQGAVNRFHIPKRCFSQARQTKIERRFGKIYLIVIEFTLPFYSASKAIQFQESQNR